MPDLTAKRTLVKSPPELWEELSEVEGLAKHLGAFGEIKITKLEPEHTVAWEGEHASGTVSIEPSGWGTKVTLHAELPEEAAPEAAGGAARGRAGARGGAARRGAAPTSRSLGCAGADARSLPGPREAAVPTGREEPAPRSHSLRASGADSGAWLFRTRTGGPEVEPEPVAIEPEPEPVEPEPVAGRAGAGRRPSRSRSRSRTRAGLSP